MKDKEIKEGMGCKVEKNARKIEVKNTATTIGLQDFNRDVMG